MAEGNKITIRLTDEELKIMTDILEKEDCKFNDKTSWVKNLVQTTLHEIETMPSEIEMIKIEMEGLKEQNRENYGKLRNGILAIGFNLNDDKEEERLQILKKSFPEIFSKEGEI